MDINEIKTRLRNLPSPEMVKQFNPQQIEIYLNEVKTLKSAIDLEKARSEGILKAHRERVDSVKKELLSKYGTDSLPELLKLRDSYIEQIHESTKKALSILEGIN